MAKPRIYRTWSTRTAQFYWAVDQCPTQPWGMGVKREDRRAWNQAWGFAHELNRKQAEKQSAQR